MINLSVHHHHYYQYEVFHPRTQTHSCIDCGMEANSLRMSPCGISWLAWNTCWVSSWRFLTRDSNDLIAYIFLSHPRHALFWHQGTGQANQWSVHSRRHFWRELQYPAEIYHLVPLSWRVWQQVYHSCHILTSIQSPFRKYHIRPVSYPIATLTMIQELEWCASR